VVIKLGGIKSRAIIKIKHCLLNIRKASETIINAAYEGDQFAIALLSEAGYKIGRDVYILIHL
jgi:hypothetical protein